jgi:hypothetical protein
VSPADPVTLVLVVLLLAVVAGASSSLPAFRAMRIDPMAAIREHETELMRPAMTPGGIAAILAWISVSGLVVAEGSGHRLRSGRN